MKNFVFIPCHLNKQYKIDRLEKILDEFKDEYIVLGSHIEIPPNIKEKSDFSFEEKENLIIGIDVFSKYGDIYAYAHFFNYSLKRLIPYHGYGHVSLVRNAYLLSLGKKFKNFYHINYDVEVEFFNKEKMKKFDELLESYDAVFHEWMSFKDRYDFNVFGFKKNDNIESFLKMRDFDEWDGQGFGFSTEQFLYKAFIGYNNYVIDMDERIDKSDFVDNVEAQKISYQHPYSGGPVGPALLYIDDDYLHFYLHNSTEKEHHVQLFLNDREIHNFSMSPNTFHIKPLGINDGSEKIVKFIVNDVVRNIFDASNPLYHAEVTKR